MNIDNAKASFGSILIKIDTKNKERYNLTPEIQIAIEKGYNFNLREDRPSLAAVINGANMPKGATVLVNYLALEPTYELVGKDLLTKKEWSEGYKVYAIPKDMCFCYLENNEWIPCENFLLTLRVFKPYEGKMEGILPEVVKNRMYIVKGWDEYDGTRTELSGKAAVTSVNCDYEIIFHNKENREERLIRTMSRELLAIDDITTKKIKKGELLVGYSANDAKKL